MKVKILLAFLISAISFTSCANNPDNTSATTNSQLKNDTSSKKVLVQNSDVAYTDNIIRWAVSDDYTMDKENIRTLNAKLLDDGYDFNLEIVPVSSQFSAGYDADKLAEASADLAVAMAAEPDDLELYNSTGGNLARNDVPEKYRDMEYFDLCDEYFADYIQNIESLEQQPDIVNLSGYVPEYRWKALINDGYAEPLDAYLTNALELTELFAEKCWQSVSCNDKVFALPNSYVEPQSIVYSFNRDYVSDEQISNFDMQFSSLGEMLKNVKASDDFIPIYCNFVSPEIFALTTASNMQCGITLSENGGAEPFYENTQLAANYNALRDYYDNDLFGFDFKLSQNFMFTDAEKPEHERVNDILKNQNFAIAVTYGDFTHNGETLSDNFTEKKCMPVLSNTFSGTTVIKASSKKKEQAFELLNMVYTNEDYQKLLIDISGYDYQQNTNRVEIGADLLLGINGHDVESVKSYFTNDVEASQFIADCPDLRSCVNELSELNKIFTDTADFWKQGDKEQNMSDIRKQMKQAGIDDICDLINK